MDEPSPRAQAIFFELFEGLPRQGPGHRASTARALALCRDLPPAPGVVDLGCGTGAQTLDLAELTSGTIVALDLHAPSVERLATTLAERGLETRVRALVADMAEPGLPLEHFDLVWSEGALYNLGLDRALAVCRSLLRPGGYLAFTDAVWLSDDPPAEVKALFATEYPTMGRVPDVLARLVRHGFSVVDHFTLPDAAWWDDFYTPMQHRIEELRARYAGDAEAQAALDGLAEEPANHPAQAAHFAYEFFVARRDA